MTRFSKTKFDNSDAYYEAAGASKVNERSHKIARNGAFIGLWLRDGPLKMRIPESVRALNGQPSVIASAHRSKSDIPYFVKITEAAGQHHARPLSKVEYFKNPILSRFFHDWGAVAVDREEANLKGVNVFGAAALKAGYPVLVFTEGTRIKSIGGTGIKYDTRIVMKPKRTAAYLAVQNHAPLIPMAIAGVADNDERKPFIFGKPVVAVMGDPIIPELWTPDQDRAEHALLSQSREISHEMHVAQQAALDLAYQIRES